MESLTFLDWGTISYIESYNKQKELFNSLIQQKIDEENVISNCIIFCEHPHVITIGKNGLSSNLLFPEHLLKSEKIEFYHVDRGGDITYHGPGQVVIYLIIDLESFGLSLKSYIYLLEESIIILLRKYLINAERLKGATGVWIDVDKPEQTRKICAIGVRCSRYVTMHGLALNVNTDLSYFQMINPCGFINKGVTSIKEELKSQIDIELLKNSLIAIFSNQFN